MFSLVFSLALFGPSRAFSFLETPSFVAPASLKVCPLPCSPRLDGTRLFRKPDKWDLILDEFEDGDDDELVGGGGPAYLPCPPDMMYEPRIVQRAHQTFLAIRGAGGKETTNDVYVRDPIEKEVFWYSGKVARVSDVSLEDCIQRMYPMIERHACHLRPKELYPYRGNLEIWTAPGDSELEVAYNRPTIKFQKHLQPKACQYKRMNSKYPTHVKAATVGFQGEVYQDGEDGFRTWRNDDGLPARPELNPGGEARPPTPEELEKIQQELGEQMLATDVDDKGYIDAEVTKESKDS